MKHIKSVSAYKDLKEYKVFNDVFYTSEEFNKDFIKELEDHKSDLYLNSSQIKTLEKLLEKNIVILAIDKQHSLKSLLGTKGLSAMAYYNSVADIIVVYTIYFYKDYKISRYVNFKRAVSTLWHELAHYLYAHKPLKTLKIFEGMFLSFYKLSMYEWLKFYIPNVNKTYLDYLDGFIKHYMLTADGANSGTLLKYFSNSDISNSPILPDAVKKGIKDYLAFLDEIHLVIEGRKRLTVDHKKKIKLLQLVHFEVAGIYKDRDRYSSGMPVQEVVIPSEILCIQSEINPLIRQQVMRLVGEIV